MGGIKKDHASTKNLVDNARKLREQRLEERTKQYSATKIQSRIRGNRARNVMQLLLISELDQKVTGVKNIKSILSLRNQSFNVPVESILLMLKYFYFIYRNETKPVSFGSHLQSVSTLMVESLNVSLLSSEFNLLSKLISSSSAAVTVHPHHKFLWMFYVKRFLQLVLDYVDKLFTSGPRDNVVNNMTLINSLFQLMFFNDPKGLSVHQQLELSQTLSLIMKSIMLPACNVLCRTFRFVNDHNDASSSPDMAVMSNIASLLLQLVVTVLKDERVSSSLGGGVDEDIQMIYVTRTILTLSGIHQLHMFHALLEFLAEADCAGWRRALNLLSTQPLIDLDTYVHHSHNNGDKLT
jgi:hypothetical protein